ALEHRLDRAVGPVADPTRDPGGLRRLPAPLPVPDALHPAPDDDAAPDHGGPDRPVRVPCVAHGVDRATVPRSTVIMARGGHVDRRRSLHGGPGVGGLAVTPP